MATLKVTKTTKKSPKRIKKLKKVMKKRVSRISKSPKGHDKIKIVMEEFKEGALKSGKSDKKVTNPKQAIAIALSEQRKKEKGR